MTVPQAATASIDAGLATRLLAFAADALVINAAVWFVGAVVALGLSIITVPHDVRTALAVLGAGVAVLWCVAYFAFFWSAGGQTPGDRLMRIRVVDGTSGESIPTRRALLRVIVLPLSVIPLGAGILMILVDSRRRALHDCIARTVVVYVPDAPPEPHPSRRPIERPRATASERDDTSSLR